jgi:hypothetical protein
MVKTYYNMSYGNGMEGLLNWGNSYVDGWLVNAFLLVIFGVIAYVMNKGEWKLPTVMAFASFVTLITAIVFKLFTDVSETMIFILIIVLGASTLWSILSKQS